MTAAEAKTLAIASRIQNIEEVIRAAANNGLFETRAEKLTIEQKEFLLQNGYNIREIEQKGGSTWEIKFG